jgi:putative peptide zinc metalloprotease protein
LRLHSAFCIHNSAFIPMLQIRPTFSESWYRVAELKARLRPSAQISRQFYRGERWYVVRDPAGNQFHRLSDAAYRFIGLLDGTRTVEQAWDICGGQLADDAPTQPEIIQILSHLYSANLIEANVTPDATVLLRGHKQLTKRKMQNRLMNVLFPRIPLWDPDQFLCRWLPVVRPLISVFGAIVWLLVVSFAIITIAPHWADLKAGASNAIDPKNWLWLWATPSVAVASAANATNWALCSWSSFPRRTWTRPRHGRFPTVGTACSSARGG